MSKTTKQLLLVLGLGLLTLTSGAKADEWNQKTVFTFSGPVEIPGQVLPGGTYVFKLHNSASNRHIVQVFNKDENHVFGTFLAIPDYRLHPSSKPLIKFDERAEGQPQAIKAWFYPGRTYGHEFVYPKDKARVLATANKTPVPAMPVELTPDTNKPDIALDAPEIAALDAAPLQAEKPDGEEVALSEAFQLETVAADAPAEEPETLPATASQLPLIAAAGALSLGAALALRSAASKAN